MKKEVRTQLKEWWDKCPSKSLTITIGIVMASAGMYCIYQLGYGFGKFLCNIGI